MNTFGQLLIIHRRRPFAHDKNKIDMIDDPIGLKSDNFFNHPAHAVAHDGIANLFARRHPYAESLHLRAVEDIKNQLVIRE